jgi:hypothetical protein
LKNAGAGIILIICFMMLKIRKTGSRYIKQYERKTAAEKTMLEKLR